MVSHNRDSLRRPRLTLDAVAPEDSSEVMQKQALFTEQRHIGIKIANTDARTVYLESLLDAMALEAKEALKRFAIL